MKSSKDWKETRIVYKYVAMKTTCNRMCDYALLPPSSDRLVFAALPFMALAPET